MRILRCHCRACRRGLRTPSMSYIVRKKVKAARSKTKMLIRLGKFDDLPTKIYVGYTD